MTPFGLFIFVLPISRIVPVASIMIFKFMSSLILSVPILLGMIITVFMVAISWPISVVSVMAIVYKGEFRKCWWRTLKCPHAECILCGPVCFRDFCCEYKSVCKRRSCFGFGSKNVRMVESVKKIQSRHFLVIFVSLLSVVIRFRSRLRILIVMLRIIYSLARILSHLYN